MNWNDALRELHNLICDLYNEPGSCHGFALRAGLNIGNIVLEGLSIRHQWQNVIDEAWKTGKLQQIIDVASYEYKNRQPEIIQLWKLYQEQILIVNASSPNQSIATIPRFKYSCFISCFHCPDELNQRIVKELHKGLSEEMKLFREESVYLDQNRLATDFSFGKGLASDLCQSACMVVIYTPKYFHLNHIYCAREFHAMELLEEKRFDLLKLTSRQEHGFIIPIVFRGTLPDEIRKDRRWYDFDNFILSSRQMFKDRRFGLKIKQIAEYINDRCEVLERLPEDINLCDNFNIPQDDEALTFLNQFTSTKRPFPGR